MMNTNCPNCPNCPNCQIWKIGSLQPPLPSPRPILRSSSAAARQRCRPEITISDGKWGAILELLAAITRVLTSRMKKRLRLWLTKLINLLVYANYIDIKWRVKNYRNLKKIMKSSRRNSKCASLLLDFLF